MTSILIGSYYRPFAHFIIDFMLYRNSVMFYFISFYYSHPRCQYLTTEELNNLSDEERDLIITLNGSEGRTFLNQVVA
jgi:hypothetical protein